MKTGLEDYEIYVQTQPFPNSIVAAHPCNDLTGRMSQIEARAALAGYIFGAKLAGSHFFPFFASQAHDKEGQMLEFGRRLNFLAEITDRGYDLPKDFDPIIFAYKPRDDEHSLRRLLVDSVYQSVEREINFFFTMFPVEKKPTE